MPSMRSMMTAGPALKKCNIAGYNCSYLPIDHPHAFDEVLYILMNGTGALLSIALHNGAGRMQLYCAVVCLSKTVSRQSLRSPICWSLLKAPS
jgi:hypothetical protein